VSIGIVALLAAAIVIAVVAISGCGGSGGNTASGDSKPKPKPLTRSELIAKADAICIESQKAFKTTTEEAFPPHTSVPNPSERLPNVEYSEYLVEISRRAVRQLNSLSPPPPLRADYEAYVSAVEEVEGLALQALRASVADDGGAYLKARKTRDAGALERYDLARAVGLEKCSPSPFR
jgi:hypothetical protein